MSIEEELFGSSELSLKSSVGWFLLEVFTGYVKLFSSDIHHDLGSKADGIWVA